MKVVILAGECGGAITERSQVGPGPMIETKPTLQDILNMLCARRLSDFVIGCSNLSHKIKEFRTARCTAHGLIDAQTRVQMRSGERRVARSGEAPWRLPPARTMARTECGFGSRATCLMQPLRKRR